MLTVEEARARVLAAVRPLAPVEVLVNHALGLVAARDLVAPHPLPRFDNSSMDGYALRRSDAAGAAEAPPVKLELVGETRAGDPGEIKVLPGQAARIMTGAPLPAGADAVVPIENAEERGGQVAIKSPPPPGGFVRPAGDDVRAGDVVVQAGAELGPGELAVVASLGLSPLQVRARPRVAVLVTGDELVAPEATPAPGQIRDSNSVALRALASEAGADVTLCARLPDRPEPITDALREASERSDLVVSSGGVAVGKYDFVKEALEAAGRLDAWRVAMQPGKPVVLGTIGTTPFLGLPGNPVSIHVGFEQFVRPAVRKMRGCASLLRPEIRAVLTEPIEKPAGRLHFVRVRLSQGDGSWRATPTGRQGSHIQSSLVGCDGVARFDADKTRLEAGSEVVVEVWKLPEGAS